MTKESEKGVGREQDLPEQGAHFAHRRKVIRGLVGVPVALTLSSGAASARTSSVCLTVEPTQAVPQCKKTSNTTVGQLDPSWQWGTVTPKPTATGGVQKPEKFCVAYAEPDDASPTDFKVVGFNYNYNLGGPRLHTFIDQNGDATIRGSSNPLRASCAGSFIKLAE